MSWSVTSPLIINEMTEKHPKKTFATQMSFLKQISLPNNNIIPSKSLLSLSLLTYGSSPLFLILLLCFLLFSGISRKMFDIGDDLVIDSYRIAWLIWIQVLVMFLLTLTILLTYFGFFAIDSSPTSDYSLTSSSPLRFDPPSTCSHRTQIAGNNDVQDKLTTNYRTRGVENNAERDGSPVKDLAHSLSSRRFIHPCCYLDLAKQAFLKCLGLGATHQTPPARDKEHDD